MNRDAIQRIVENTLAALPREECRTCDCFQGFLVQLELDAECDVTDLVAPHKAAKEYMHGCLGCAPCPPGSAYATYIKKRKT